MAARAGCCSSASGVPSRAMATAGRNSKMFVLGQKSAAAHLGWMTPPWCAATAAGRRERMRMCMPHADGIVVGDEEGRFLSAIRFSSLQQGVYPTVVVIDET